MCNVQYFCDVIFIIYRLDNENTNLFFKRVQEIAATFS